MSGDSKAHTNPPSPIEEILRNATWGDYQKQDGTWGYGLANAPTIEAALLEYIDSVIGPDTQIDTDERDALKENNGANDLRAKLREWFGL